MRGEAAPSYLYKTAPLLLPDHGQTGGSGFAQAERFFNSDKGAATDTRSVADLRERRREAPGEPPGCRSLPAGPPVCKLVVVLEGSRGDRQSPQLSTTRSQTVQIAPAAAHPSSETAKYLVADLSQELQPEPARPRSPKAAPETLRRQRAPRCRIITEALDIFLVPTSWSPGARR